MSEFTNSRSEEIILAAKARADKENPERNDSTIEAKCMAIHAYQTQLICTVGPKMLGPEFEEIRKSFTIMILCLAPEILLGNLPTFLRTREAFMRDLVDLKDKL